MPLDEALRGLALDARGDASAALSVADAAGKQLDGAGPSAVLEVLAELGALDLTVARVVEPHLDALIILAEAGTPAAGGRWGVFAAEAPGTELLARETSGQWRLSGVKPWCSLAGRLDRALVTATTVRGRQLFSVDLHDAGVDASANAWVARGLVSVVTSDVRFDDVAAEAVGVDDWYLTRPGFAWGGIRVAACWFGGARALVDVLRDALAARPDPVRSVNLGRADVALWTASLALRHAGSEMDAGRATGPSAALLAARTRAAVADAAETVMREVGHALGPAPLAFDEEYARRIADLTLYVRQHHAERDLAALATMVTTA